MVTLTEAEAYAVAMTLWVVGVVAFVIRKFRTH